MENEMIEQQAQCFIMAGGNGTRLHPLTADMPKPALMLGSDNRLIDPAIKECARVASSLSIASRNFDVIDY
jgi:ADP-glucose pyrophosphorylase